MSRDVPRNYGKGGGLEGMRTLRARGNFDHAPSTTQKVEVHCYNKKHSKVG